jgi:hypothetical protein
MTRAKIKPHSPMSPGGPTPPYLNFNYEVKNQEQPTEARPISQHHQFAGMPMPGPLQKHN